MKKYYFLIILALILGLVLTGCSLLSNISQVPATEQSSITSLTKGWPSSLVGLWHFDEGSGTVAFDSSVNSNDGTVYGAGWVDGKFGKALSFDGINDYVDCGMVVDDSVITGITLEAWIKCSYTNTYDGGIISNNLTWISKKGYDFFLENGKLGIDVGNGTVVGRVLYTMPTPGIGEPIWRHVAATWDGSLVKLYVDGAEVGTAASLVGNYSDPNQDTFVGKINTPSRPVYTYPFEGFIDEVRIWDVALSKDELGKVYDFDGFFSPVDMYELNIVKAGRAIPVKFSLNGDQGLDIFQDGYPISAEIVCGLADPDIETIEGTDTAGGSSLSYNIDADQYIYVWKTEKDWTGCRQLIVKLNDGQSYYTNFQFK